MKSGLLTLAVALTFVIGCGGAGLSATEKLRVARAEQAFSLTVLNGSHYGETIRGVDQLIALCRAKGAADYDGRTVKQVLEDAANELRPYQPELAAELDRVLDDGCS